MMEQARQIRRAIVPNEVLFVVDAMIGQDAVNTAMAFDEGVNFTGIVLSKLDGDARGGAALSVSSVTGKPVMFASTGEGLDDFELFHPDRMASRILDIGDVLTLIEQAEQNWDKDEAARMAKKFADQEDFTLDDFLAQMQQIRNMGSMKKMLMMMPGAQNIRQQLEQFDEREIDRVEAIVRSMTPHERVAPEDHQRLPPGPYRPRLRRARLRGQRPAGALCPGPEDDEEDGRRRRHARNAGDARHGRRRAPARAPRAAPKKKARSGNPAKAAQELKDAEARRAAGAKALPTGAAFGQQGGDFDPSQLNLPKGFDKFLGGGK